MKISVNIIVILFKLLNTISALKLCEDSRLDAATRLSDGSIVLFKGNLFWLLSGLPADEGRLSHSMPIKNRWSRMLSSPQAVMTTAEGHSSYRNTTYAFHGRYWDSFGPDGSFQGRQYWREIPAEGFTAALHNENKTNPIFVAFAANQVSYYKTSGRGFEKIVEKINNFPPDIEAAFGLPDGNVYLFKGTKFCKRQFTSKVHCPEWKNSEELFGCYTVTLPVSNISDYDEVPKPSESPEYPEYPEQKVGNTAINFNKASVFHNNVLLLFLFIQFYYNC